MSAHPIDESIAPGGQVLQSEWTRVARLCARLTGDMAAAEDLAQETMLVAWQHAHELRDPAARSAWLAGIARRRCADWARRRGRERGCLIDVRGGDAHAVLPSINALSFLVSFGAVRAIRVAPTAGAAAAAAAPDKPGSVLRELGAGLHFFVGERTLMALLVASVLFTFGGGAIDALDIFFVTGNLHAPAGYYGFLGAAQGVGAIAGALLGSAFAERIGLTRAFTLSLLLTGLGHVVYARMTGFWPAAILLGVLGVPNAAFNVALGPLLLRVTPHELVGRVSAVLMPAVNLSLLSSGLLAGYLDSTALRGFHVVLLGMAWGPLDTIFAVSGLLMVAGGLYACATL